VNGPLGERSSSLLTHREDLQKSSLGGEKKVRKTLIGIALSAVVLFSGSALAQGQPGHIWVDPCVPSNIGGCSLPKTSIPAGAIVAEKVTLPGGTPLRLGLAEGLWSENAHKDASVAFEVMDDVTIDGITLIRCGALAYGRLVDASTANGWNVNGKTEWSRRIGKPGKIFVQLLSVTDVTGREIPIEEKRYMEARSTTPEVVIVSIATVDPFLLLVRGRNTRFHKGQVIVAMTKESAEVDLTRLAENMHKVATNSALPSPVPTPASAPKPATPSQVQTASMYTLTLVGALVPSR
jgi:hypothetical protein